MTTIENKQKTFLDRFLDFIEKAGNKLPDPAMLFFLLMLLTWVFSALLSPIDFGAVDPRSGNELRVQNLLTGSQFASFLANMTNVFINFPPL
jgi:aminobenzoyl-glutamate transport protein